MGAAVRVAGSARKHGISARSARHVVESAPLAFPLLDEEGEAGDLLLFVGDEAAAPEVPRVLRADQVMTVAKQEWTPEREAAAVARAEAGYEPGEVGPAIPNPFRKRGRPPLSPDGSKALTARIPAALHGEVVALARTTGRSLSELTRDALAAYLARSTCRTTSGASSPRRG